MPHEIQIYDEIGPGWAGLIDAAAVGKMLDKAGGEDIVLRINSGGGDVFEGNTIYQRLRDYAKTAKVTTRVDGLAASIATVIALAGEAVEIAPLGYWMVHNSWTVAAGDRHAFRKTADLLEKIDGTIRDLYARRTGATAEQVEAWMDAETWMDASEALGAGFAQTITEDTREEIELRVAEGMPYRNVPAAVRRVADNRVRRQVAAQLRKPYDRYAAEYRARARAARLGIAYGGTT